LGKVELGSYLKIEADQVRFRYEFGGKPSLDLKYGRAPLRFNMSHSHNLILYGVTRRREIGVDVEKIRPLLNMDLVAASLLSRDEHARFSALPVCQRQGAFFRYWTLKEAYTKAIGKGFAQPPHLVEILPMGVGEPTHLLCTKGIDADVPPYLLHELPLIRGYVAAFAINASQ